MWRLDDVQGNVSPEVKQKLVQVMTHFTKGHEFGYPVFKRTKVKEMSLFEREEDSKLQARMVFEITEQPTDMVNGGNTLHGGCSAYLIDVCTSALFTLLGIAQNNVAYHVSQSLNTVFHAGASPGSKLEIVNTTTSMGGRVMTARSEIWDVTNHRLVASGTHIKMYPTTMPKL
ncbi:hypothetical protein B0H21DRAFT_824142 [Amylocystis lapponica]|nr:hypothetical protein B0H21DRAFT_824142 [Amylocystis lapponica]